LSGSPSVFLLWAWAGLDVLMEESFELCVTLQSQHPNDWRPYWQTKIICLKYIKY
jgi:hypothetical protein